MYEIKKKTRTVCGKPVTTWEREVIGANTMGVEAGTNGYKGGDFGHGSRTYIRICCDGGDIEVNVLKDRTGYTEGVEIILGGDSELSTMIDSLKFAVKALEDGANGNIE